MSYDISIIIILLSIVCCIESIMFHLTPGIKKCFKEEIHKNVFLSGEYELSEAPGQNTLLIITDTKGHILYKKENAISGKFGLSTEDYDTVEICFSTTLLNGRGVDRMVTLTSKHGADAKPLEDVSSAVNIALIVAQAKKLKPLEVELKKLEELALSIVNTFAFMREREKEMRDTNESTHSRVLYFSVISMISLFGLAIWQFTYLRSFFKSKKLID